MPTMPTMPQSNEIYRKAANWSAQADGDAFSAEQQAALDAWLGEDSRHLGAYLAVRATLARVERLGGAAQNLMAEGDRPKTLSVAARTVPRRVVLAGAIAAVLAVVVLCGTVWQANTYEAFYTTALGETKVVALADGSTITLNTATAATVRYDLLGRNITLQRGEALFDVAKNKWRPFVVTAGRAQVRAVGTSFDVTCLQEQPLRVTVRDGIVEVKAAGISGSVSVAAGRRAVGQPDGQFAVETLPDGQLARDLAWRDGYIFFRRQTLADAAREFERYSKLRILIDDPVLASRTVTGRYVSTDPVGFAKAVALFWGLDVAVSQNGVHLSQKKG